MQSKLNVPKCSLEGIELGLTITNKVRVGIELRRHVDHLTSLLTKHYSKHLYPDIFG